MSNSKRNTFMWPITIGRISMFNGENIFWNITVKTTGNDAITKIKKYIFIGGNEFDNRYFWIFRDRINTGYKLCNFHKGFFWHGNCHDISRDPVFCKSSHEYPFRRGLHIQGDSTFGFDDLTSAIRWKTEYLTDSLVESLLSRY